PRTRRRVPGPRNTTSTCGTASGSGCCRRPNGARKPSPRPRRRTRLARALDFSVTRFVHANRCPPPDQVRGHASLENATSVHEHDRLAAIEDDAVLEVMTHGAREHAALDVAALAREIFRRVAVADALDVLVDDRALVEVARDVMRSGADQLDATLMGLVVGPCALEARQERVVDVDA